MVAIANQAIKGNERLTEFINLEDKAALYASGNKEAKLPQVQPDDPAQYHTFMSPIDSDFYGQPMATGFMTAAFVLCRDKREPAIYDK